MNRQRRGFQPPTGLLLGWERQAHRPFGFANADDHARTPGRPIVYTGDNHLIAFSPTGGGKGRSYLISLLLTNENPAVVLDVKGEAYHVTARRRREMGHTVRALDPFHLVSSRSDRLNPFDLMRLPGSTHEDDSEMLASNLAVGHDFTTDRYWNDTATGLLSGLCAHIATTSPTEERNLTTLRRYLHHDDLDYLIATWLDGKVVTSPLARDEFVAYLAAPSDRTRPCIRSTACTYVKALGSQDVGEALSGSTLDLHDVLTGAPVDVFVIVPPEKLESHKSLLRLWVSTLLTTICRRRVIPRRRTLFFLDEAAQLGALPSVRQALTLLRGYGVQMFTFWQDLSQLRLLFPQDWETILNNSGVLTLFGLTPLMARSWGEVLSMDPAELRRIASDEALLSTVEGFRVVRRPDYLRDPLFGGLFDANPRFALQTETRADHDGAGLDSGAP